MKFFTKRLNKKKLTKSHSETKLVTPVAHQHDNNKPLPPSPSSTSLPPSALTANLATKDVETINNDSWLELNLPNDFSSSLDIPQLQPHQSKEVPSNKLEINTEKSLSPEAEKITEVSSFSYPNNFINTTTHNEVNKPESTETVVTALESSNILMPSVDVDKESQREKSSLQPVEKQGDTLLNDTSRDAIVLVDATLIPTADMQQIQLEEKDGSTMKEHNKDKEQAKGTAVGLDVLHLSAVRAATPPPTTTLASTSASGSVVLVELDTENTITAERGEDMEEIVEPNSCTLTEQEVQATESPVEKCHIENENLSDVLMAESPALTTSSPSMLIPLLPIEPSLQTASPESSPEDVQKESCKLATRKSAISLIPRKQQPVNLPDAIVKRDGRRASSSSFIPVLATRHQQQTSSICPTQSKEVLTTAPVTWSPSSSSERNSVSSDSASSCSSSQHQEKRMSLIAKPSATQPHLQSKIPKASFGVPLTVNTEISKSLTAQQHVSRLPTKRNSTLV
ncbi:hypothetical protein G6F42_013076 [Rhizopus arrhizus]|nr:hypothetical protein G6F42_013076 [Rhizopus arrhizus]